jgi:hypothetical protein
MDRSYSIGFEYIDDTAAHTGRFLATVCTG